MLHMFKVIRSNTEIAITPPRIVRFRSSLVQSLVGCCFCTISVPSLLTKFHFNSVYNAYFSLFTALHVMQTRFSDENSVRLSVCRWSEIADFHSIFARSASAVTPSKKVQLTLIRSPLRAFQ